MCTVSIVSGRRRRGSWLRVACNRDERRDRPPALPPRRMRCGRHLALLPIDPVGGGTWIAVTTAGLGFVLLNLNAGPVTGSAQGRSRGLIIPALLAAHSLDEAAAAAGTLDATRYLPFRLLIVSDRELVEFAAAGAAVALRCRERHAAAAFFTSSSLGDWLVDGPRRRVFRKLLVEQAPTRNRQDALHRHRWPRRTDVSICMERADARTVSHTTFEIAPDRVRLDYHGGPLDEAARSWSLAARRN